MVKKTSRRIKYATYKSLLSNCNAYDYDKETKTIMVDLPEDVLTNSEFLPDGWDSKFYFSSGSVYERVETNFKFAEIHKKTRDGIAIYTCKVVKYDENHPYGQKYTNEFINYHKAVDWCNSKLN